MKTVSSIILAVVIGLVFTTSAAIADDKPPFSGFLGNPSVYDLLQPGPPDGVKLRWIKPGVDFAKYKKFMIDSVIFFLADKADYKGIDPQEMKDLCDQFNKEIVDTLRDKYPIVADPGPDVMRVRVAITNIKPSRPGVSAITSIVPVGLGVSLVKKGATGGWAGSGQTAMEIIFLDSVTSEVVCMGVDQQTAAFDARFSKWGSANDAFKFWAERLWKGTDKLLGVQR